MARTVDSRRLALGLGLVSRSARSCSPGRQCTAAPRPPTATSPITTAPTASAPLLTDAEIERLLKEAKIVKL